MTGGYVMVDGTGIVKNSAAFQEITVPGIWDKVKIAVKTGKPIWLFNMVDSHGGRIGPIPLYPSDTGSENEIMLLGPVYWMDFHPNDLIEIDDKLA